MCVFPLFHMAAWTIALQQWQARDGVVFLSCTTAEVVCAEIERHRATRINAVPLIWRRILDHLATLTVVGTALPDLSSLRFADTGTSATPPELLAAMMRALPHAEVRVFYGSTEAGNVATLEHHVAIERPGSVGVASLQTELRLDAVGELCVRSPLLFDGYFENDAATGAAFVDGWYRTGDLAEFDSDGFLSIIGRARDVIRTGGESVAPAEVEAVLLGVAAISDVAVVGVADADWGELVCAVIVVRRGCDAPGLADLRAHCEGRLASFKQPKRVVIGLEDPFPAVAGAGIARLRESGIAVDVGVEREACERLVRPYLKRQTKALPWVIAKWAMTLDGRMATSSGDSKWISCDGARENAHATRGRMDAICVGIETALRDDPMLTARPAGPRTATRVVFDSLARLPVSSQLAQTAREFPTLVCCGPSAPSTHIEHLRACGCEVWIERSTSSDDRVLGLLTELAQRGHTNVLVDGGPRLLGSLFDRQLVDEAQVYIACKFVGGSPNFVPNLGQGLRWMRTAIELRDVEQRIIDGDLLMQGSCSYSKDASSI